MAKAHERSEWDRAAIVVQKLHNVNCSKRGDMILDPRTLNPYREQPKKEKLPLKEVRKIMEGRA